MANEGSPSGTREERSFEDLAIDLGLVDLSARGAVERVNAQYDRLVAMMDRELQGRFGDHPLIDDARASAFRTFLRRVSTNQFALDPGTTVESFLVSMAIAKAYRLRRSRERPSPAAEDVADAGPDPVAELAGREEDEDRAAIKEAMRRELRAALRKMRPFLENRTHRRIFDILFAMAYEGAEEVTCREIATRLGCSERLVERVRQKYHICWEPLINQSRHDLRAMFAGLGVAMP